MEPVSYTKAGVPVYAPVKASDIQSEIDPLNKEEILRAALPMFDHKGKSEYLTYRACGFSFRESCQMARVREYQIRRWRREDSTFASWESERITELHKQAAPIILNFQFTRNILLAMKIDNDVLTEAAFHWDKLSAEKREYLKVIRKHYTPQDMIALQKALGERQEGDIGDGNLHLKVEVEGELVQREEAERVAARKLLMRFSTNIAMIEGDYEVKDDVAG